jgi:molybdopterin molybdotransferase
LNRAEQIILKEVKDYGNENIYFENAIGRVLAERSGLTGIFRLMTVSLWMALPFGSAALEKGITSFTIAATQAAGETPVQIQHENECIEIMTGAALPGTADTIIQYEWLILMTNKQRLKRI